MKGEAEPNEWHCNLIIVFYLYSNTDNEKAALREQEGKIAPTETERLHLAPEERQ